MFYSFMMHKKGVDVASVTLAPTNDGTILSTDMKFNPITGDAAAIVADTQMEMSATDLATFIPVGSCNACNTTIRAHCDDAHQLVTDHDKIHCPACGGDVAVEVSMRDMIAARKLDSAMDSEGGDETEMVEEAEEETSEEGMEPGSDEIDSESEEDMEVSEEESEEPEEDMEAEDMEVSEEESEEDMEDSEGEFSSDEALDLAINDVLSQLVDSKSDKAAVKEIEVEDEEIGLRKLLNGENLTADVAFGITPATALRLDSHVNANSDIACILDPTHTRYFVLADGRPVGVLNRAGCNADSASAFDKAVFATAFTRAIQRGEDVACFGYQPYTISIDTSALLKAVSDKAIASKVDEASSQFNNRVERIKAGMAVAATASSKNIWSDFANPLRDGLVNALARLNIQDRSLVEAAFARHGVDYATALVNKGLELSEKSDDAFNAIKTLVDNASAVVAPAVTSVASDLAKGGYTLVEEVAPKAKADTAKTVTGFDWSTAFNL